MKLFVSPAEAEARPATPGGSAAEAARHFAASTSAHGFGKLNHPLRLFRAAWTILIIAAAVAFGANLWLMAEKFSSQPVSVSIDPKGADLLFPDVTVCRRSAVAVSAGFEFNETPAGGSVELIQDFLGFKRALSSFSRIASDAADNLYGIDDDTLSHRRAGMTQTELQRILALKYDTGGAILKNTLGRAYINNFTTGVEKMLLVCSYGFLGCEAAQLASFAHASFTSCFTFGLKQFIYDLQQQNVTQVDKNSQLHLVLFTDSLYPDSVVVETFADVKDETMGMLGGPAVAVFIHQPGTYPTFGARMEASGLTETTISVRHRKFEFANRRAKPCKAATEASVAKYDEFDTRTAGVVANREFAATRADCVNHVTQWKFFDSCGCVSSGLPVPSAMRGQPLCGNFTRFLEEIAPGELSKYAGPLEALKEQDGKTKRKIIQRAFKDFHCLDLVKTSLTNGEFSAECPDMCDVHEYTASASSVPWLSTEFAQTRAQLQRWLASNKFFNRNPELTTEEQLGQDVWTLHRILTNSTEFSTSAFANFLSIKVKLSHSIDKSELIQEKIDYEIFDLVCDIGGILGLYLGVSVLTLCEMFELLLTVGIIASESLKRRGRTGDSGKSEEVAASC